MSKQPQQAMAYSVGYSHARNLRRIWEALGGGESELAAIDRLAEFRGTAADVRSAARLYAEAGDGANAAELLRVLL